MTGQEARVRDILANATVDGLALRLPPAQLARDEYVAVNKVLEAMGGRWSRRERVHLFATDPAPALDKYLSGGDAPLHARTAEGYVATPSDLADEVVGSYTHVADLPAGSWVLEPSAGDGALVRAVLAVNPALFVEAVEPNAERGKLIDTSSGQVAVHPEAIEEYAGRSRLHDAVVMNPPFAMPGKATAWIDHVNLAWPLLAPGGRLTSIVPAGFKHRTDRRHRAMRDLVGEYGGFDDLPEDAFGGIRTLVIWLDKPSADPEEVSR